jgi:hypothetical protein
MIAWIGAAARDSYLAALDAYLRQGPASAPG